MLDDRNTAADGSEHTVNYIADEKGYRVIGGASTFSSFGTRPVSDSVITTTARSSTSRPTSTAAPTARTTIAVKPTRPITPKPTTVATTTKPVVIEPVVVEPASVPVPVPAPAKPTVVISVPIAVTEEGEGSTNTKPAKYIPVPYPYGFNQYHTFNPFAYSGAFPYFQAGYAAIPYGFAHHYGLNSAAYGGYVLKAVRVASQKTDKKEPAVDAVGETPYFAYTV